MYKLLTEKEINKDSWSEFVINHSRGNVFHSPEFFECYWTRKESDAILIVLAEPETGEIHGLLVAVILWQGSGLSAFLSRRAVVMGCPLVSADHVMFELLSAYNNRIRRKVIYSQFRNMHDMKDYYSVFNKSGYQFQDHLNIEVQLDKSEETLWKELHSKRRNEIRKAIKEGLEVKIIETRSALMEAYQILTDVYNRARLPLQSFDFFERASEILREKGYLKIFGAFFNEKLVGVMYTLIFKDRVYDWYAGSYSGFYHKNPNDLLPWEVFRWSKSKGYLLFDFGGAGKPNEPYGVREYKMKFGGRVVNYGRFEKVYWPLLFEIARWGFYLWKKFRSIKVR